jgi:hypothetical protein
LATFDEDFITKTTANVCGIYSLFVKLNYGISTFVGDVVDDTQTTFDPLDSTNLVFNSQ